MVMGPFLPRVAEGGPLPVGSLGDLQSPWPFGIDSMHRGAGGFADCPVDHRHDGCSDPVAGGKARPWQALSHRLQGSGEGPRPRIEPGDLPLVARVSCCGLEVAPGVANWCHHRSDGDARTMPTAPRTALARRGCTIEAQGALLPAWLALGAMAVSKQQRRRGLPFPGVVCLAQKTRARA